MRRTVGFDGARPRAEEAGWFAKEMQRICAQSLGGGSENLAQLLLVRVWRVVDFSWAQFDVVHLQRSAPLLLSQW